MNGFGSRFLFRNGFTFLAKRSFGGGKAPSKDAGSVYFWRYIANKKVAGFSIADLKHHYALQPLFFYIGVGCIWAFGYATRCLLYNPDVDFMKNGLGNLEYYRNKRYQFMKSFPVDITSVCRAPDYVNMSDQEGEDFKFNIYEECQFVIRDLDVEEDGEEIEKLVRDVKISKFESNTNKGIADILEGMN